MRRSFILAGIAVVLPLAFALASCERAKLTVDQGTGPNPTLPAPKHRWFPTVNIAKAVGWPRGVTPTPAEGLRVTEYAGGLDHPRWLYVLPNGDVLVAETNAPPRADNGRGMRGFFEGMFMRRAGARAPSANRITLLRDANHDGIVDGRFTFLTGLNSPFGMALHDGTLYVADTDALLAFPYKDGDTSITAKPRKVVDLPGGPLNHHWTKNVVARDSDGRLYVSIGSNSNVGENGLEAEQGRAAIWEVLPDGRHTLYAYGLRNPVGMAFRPGTDELYAVVEERDEIGSDLVPDYLTGVRPSGFYGWPFSYYGDNVDTRVEQNPDLVATALKPDYALGPHVAVLGLSFAAGAKLGPRFADGAFVGEHGSWNRNPLSGYKVVFVPFAGGKPSGKPIDVLTGFLDKENHAQGRPVGVTIDKAGGLLVADDVGNRVWRVSAPAPAPAPVATRDRSGHVVSE
jgi:glucose/arabinose dehydrogenase